LATLSDFRTRIRAQVIDDRTPNVITDDNLDLIIQDSSRVYSQYRPLKKADESVVAANAFDVTLPADFEDGLSRITQVEFPIVATAVPTILHESRYAMLRVGAGNLLRLFFDAPAADSNIRVTYTTSHLIGAVSSTVPLSDENLIVVYSCSLAFRTIASFYSQTVDPSFDADVVNYRDRSDEYTKLANAREEEFKFLINLTAPSRRKRDSVLFRDLSTDRREESEVRRADD